MATNKRLFWTGLAAAVMAAGMLPSDAEAQSRRRSSDGFYRIPGTSMRLVQPPQRVIRFGGVTIYETDSWSWHYGRPRGYFWPYGRPRGYVWPYRRR